MAFSCSHVLSQLRSDVESSENKEHPEERKPVKRKYPFPALVEDQPKDDEILPEAVDLLESIFSSLCPFKDDSPTSEGIPVECETNIVSSSNHDDTEIETSVTEQTTNNHKGLGDIDVAVDIDDQTQMSKELDEIYDFADIPAQITGSWQEFDSKKTNNFTKGCKWAPDGSCIMTCSDDNYLRLFNLPVELWDSSKWSEMSELEVALKISEGELIYDYCWYPLMNSSEPNTCCLLSCSKNAPAHLWDAFTGELRCSYRSYNQMDEMIAARSLSFDTDGQRIFCGFEKTVRIFDVNLPGRHCEVRPTFAKKSGQIGIISCFAFTPQNRSISAIGSYGKSIGIYSEPHGELEFLLKGQRGGVTQLQFSPDGNHLYSGGRKDPEILCWDMRNLGTVLYAMRRVCSTNQRMHFDISRSGNYIVSGNNNGVITVWDTAQEPKVVGFADIPVLEPTLFFMGHNDCVNGIGLHPTCPLLCSLLLGKDDIPIFCLRKKMAYSIEQ
ncbi:telomerase Cajal body protein 1 [Caerostris extrusa]|uniref:WD repeat-containing protein 79 n=1 Tax=Caerostris extrusa TaxID=172846 RepID=A0AAV4SF36_CAEEX|nr:telomerase Cajal body protein 1 [Caerostris extrusa]